MRDGTIHPSLKPSITRLIQLFIGKNFRSVTRSLQYEYLKSLKFEGRLLDVGGGDIVDYKNIIDCHSYESVNISPDMKPSWLVEKGSSLSDLNNCFDVALSMNTFEHVLDAEYLLQSIYKTLRAGGQFYASTPFLYPVHGSPDDFFRPTASWWYEILSRNGFQNIKITPLLWGPFSTGALCSGLPGPFKKLRMIAALCLDVLYVALRFNKQSVIHNKNGTSLQNFALGYFVEACKK